MLQEARRDYPGYKVTVGKTKNKEQKNAFAGLDYDYMEKYIKTHDDDKQSIMNEYLMLRGKSDDALEIQAGSASRREGCSVTGEIADDQSSWMKPRVTNHHRWRIISHR